MSSDLYVVFVEGKLLLAIQNAEPWLGYIIRLDETGYVYESKEDVDAARSCAIYRGLTATFARLLTLKEESVVVWTYRGLRLGYLNELQNQQSLVPLCT